MDENETFYFKQAVKIHDEFYLKIFEFPVKLQRAMLITMYLELSEAIQKDQEMFLLLKKAYEAKDHPF